MKAFYRVILVNVSVSVTLLLAEVGLQILNQPHPVISAWRASDFNPTLSELEKNQLGFRGRRIEYSDDDYVIVLLGNSQVEAISCSYEWMPERRLEHHLNSSGRKTKVFTLGASGYGQDQQLLVLREYYKHFRADLVVLWESPSNDIWNNKFPTTLDGHPKPTFWLKDGELHGPSEEMGQQVRETSRVKLLNLWRRRKFGASRDLAWEKHFPPAYTPTTQFIGTAKDDWQQLWNTKRETRFENLGNERSSLAIYLIPRSKRTQYGLDLMRKLIQQIQNLVSTRGGRFVTFVTSTDLLKSTPEEEAIYEGVQLLNGKYYHTSKNQYRKSISYVNEGFDFWTIPITLEQYKVGPEDPHLNEHAVDQVMKDLAAKIDQLPPAGK